MDELANGMLVQHSSLGIGKVIAVEPTAVHVFFPDSEKRFAAKLRLPTVKPLLRTEGIERNVWLEGLSSFSLDPHTGRYALAGNWLTHEQAIAEFVARHPQGFADPEQPGKGERAARWRAAHAAWVEAFGNGQGEALLAADDVRELVKRALRVERLVVAVPGALEEGALKDALGDAAAARLFFEALLGLLSVPSPARARFDKLFAVVAGLGAAPASTWPIATIFPFIAEPGRHVALLPKPARAAAERLGCDLRYDPAPNWATYSSLKAFSARLLEALKPIGARDFCDVEWFLHATAARRPQPAGGEEARERRPARAGTASDVARERAGRPAARSRRQA